MVGVTAEEAHRRRESLRSEKREIEAVSHDPYADLSAEQLEQAVQEMHGYLDDYDQVMKQATPHSRFGNAHRSRSFKPKELGSGSKTLDVGIAQG